MSFQRRLPIGAELQPHGGVHFRVWAPKRKRVEVAFDSGKHFPLEPESGGYFSGHNPDVGDGARYRFRLDGGDDVDRLAAPLAAEFHRTGDQREQGVGLAAADPLARVELGATLTHEDRAGRDGAATEGLHAEALGVRVATVAGAGRTLRVCHGCVSLYFEMPVTWTFVSG